MKEAPLKKDSNPLWETSKLLIYSSLVVGVFNALLKNSSNQTLTETYSACYGTWERLWMWVYTLCGMNDFIVHVVGTTVSALLMFIVFNGIFLFCDITGRPKWLLKYKIQETKNQPVGREKLMRCIMRVSYNLTVVSFFTTLSLYPIAEYLGSLHKGDLPTFERLILELFVFTGVEEICFYYSHRLLHHPRLYSYFHKIHHEWTAPIGITSVYCSTLEMVMSNLLPISIGPIIMRSHLLVSWLWFGFVLFSTTIAHGGYHVPFLFSPQAHDYHHKTFNCWFGTLGILDKFHQTDKPFVGSIQAKRHIVSLSLTPVSEIFPEPDKVTKVADPVVVVGKEE